MDDKDIQGWFRNFMNQFSLAFSKNSVKGEKPTPALLNKGHRICWKYHV